MANRAIKFVQAAASPASRKLRSPAHEHLVGMQAFEIRPFLIAPVLAGETLKNLSFQANVKSGLMTAHQTGWWFETYFFYVKHRDLAERDLVTEIHVTNTTDAGLLTAADALHYHAGGINWGELCLRRIVEEYFRNEGEAWDAFVGPSGLPLCSVNADDWLDSAIREGAIPLAGQDDLPDAEAEQLMREAHGVPAGFETHYDHWLTMTRNGLIEVDFEDYLRSNGIRIPKDEINPHKPELIRYLRDFNFPHRALTPGSGEEASIIEWKITETADKDRFFSEPGFIIGCSIARPKLFKAIAGTATGLMTDAFTWLPALMADNPETSLRIVPNALALTFFPEFGGDEDVIFDVKDLLLYGEQYVAGVNVGDRAALYSALPDVDFQRRYAEAFSPWLVPAVILDPDPGYPFPVQAFVSEGRTRLQINSRVVTVDSSQYGGQANPPVV